MSTFPTARPSYLGFTSGHTLSVDQHASQHNAEQADISALSDKLGLGASTPVANTVLIGSGVGTSSWSQVSLTTMVSGVLPVANGGTGTTSTTGSGSVVFATAPTLVNPTLVTPTVADFTNANHSHENAAEGGTLGEAAIDWSTFSLNMKSATNGSLISPGNSDQDLASSGLSLAFTVAQNCNALVTVSIGVNSTSDFEFQPEIRLDGTTYIAFAPAAALGGGASNRATVRGFTYVVPLTTGRHTLSAGLLLVAATSQSIAVGGATISALVLGNVTA